MLVLPHWFRYVFNENGFLYMPAAFLFMLPLAFSLFFSRRMNARLLPPSQQPQFLQQLAKTIAPPKLSGKRRQIKPGEKLARGQRNISLRSRARREQLSRAVLWLDRLLNDKLRLIPNLETGRSINPFLMFYLIWIILFVVRFMTSNQDDIGFFGMRYRAYDISMLMQLQILFTIFMILFVTALSTLPLILLKRNREIYMDFFGIFFLLHLSFQKLRCWYWHCCMGAPWAHGIYNRFISTYVFPIQPIEAAIGTLLTILCVLFVTRSRWYKPGRGLSLALIGYALPRFFSEFLRYRGDLYRNIAAEGFIFGLTIEQVVCIVAILLAIIWWFALPLATKIMDWINSTLRRALAWIYFRSRSRLFE
ncbi:MAG: hypothetical protein FWD06_05775 [Oscillospiraceae bacterium]|nr:hypothetical protein [Oscillospiraceae bacterium]